MRVLSLRYFNPVGSDPELRTGLQLKRPSHALGKLIQAHQAGTAFSVTGVNYPTRDGTGIRDYVHVWDLAAAHIAAIERFDTICTQAQRAVAVNLGTGNGTTVRELCAAFNNVVSMLGWTPKLSLEQSIRSVLDWIPVRDKMLKD
ncbi:NAD-dependent epimerase/dehydratase family protein [Streptomyces sp. NPDC003703]|uniref:NAD-dependent epimerase/dehydratase family protein n=1 Tax=Streptomyces sp. NPDC003283 TaxID=3364681 RepID=UPI0036C47931